MPRVYVLCQVKSVPTVLKLCLRMCQTLVSMHSRSPQSKKTQSPQKTTAGGGKEAPRRGQHPEHPRTPDTRTAPQNAAREFLPLLALPESSGPLMRGGGRQAKSAFFVLFPGLNYKIEGPWLQKDIKLAMSRCLRNFGT